MEFLAPSLKNSSFFFRRTHRVFHHRFFGCFNFTTDFHIVDCICSFHGIFTLRQFLHYTPYPHLPQYYECYGFERACFTLKRFLPYTPSRRLAQPAFIKAFLGADSSSLNVAELPLSFET